jgi:hypothetical protein
VIPLHLVNPWQAVATSGSLRLFYHLNFSAQSPLMHQVQHLYRALERDLGDVSTRKHTVLLGDLNIPKVTRVPTFFTQRWGFPVRGTPFAGTTRASTPIATAVRSETVSSVRTRPSSVFPRRPCGYERRLIPSPR